MATSPIPQLRIALTGNSPYVGQMQPERHSRAERLEARVTPGQKALIQRAAELEGRSVTDFVVSSAQDAARRTVAAHESIALGAADSRAFVEALLTPPPVSERMRDTVRRYRGITGA